MGYYEEKVLAELRVWQRKMMKKPSLSSRISKGVQRSVNGLIPEKFHKIVTEAIKNMSRTVLFGSEIITGQPLKDTPLEEREKLVREKISSYKNTAAISGAGTGAGGLLLGLADFPILLSLKMKFLFDTASLYGYNVKDYKERLYILYVFQLAFCSDQRRLEIYKYIQHWQEVSKDLPRDINEFDWRTFQQEYRDYMDLAKMLQLVPGIGAVVGAYANYQLMDKLGETAVNAYRMRLLDDGGLI
ncbi:MAG: EcsC family protein [Bacillota bacterium]